MHDKFRFWHERAAFQSVGVRAADWLLLPDPLLDSMHGEKTFHYMSKAFQKANILPVHQQMPHTFFNTSYFLSAFPLVISGSENKSCTP